MADQPGPYEDHEAPFTPVKQNRCLDPLKLPPTIREVYDKLPRGEHGGMSAEQAAFWGLAGKPRKYLYDVPGYDYMDCDKIDQHGNCFIVMGYDRWNRSYTSGQQCSHNYAMDIVVGREGSQARGRDYKGGLRYVPPDFKRDACRIYISQRSNIDHYLALAKGTVGNTTKKKPLATIALKSDTLRLVARHNIKLVTRTDDLDSQNGKCSNVDVGGYGINLIGCNDDGPGMMQPIVKGNNLIDCLSDIVTHIDNLRDVFMNFLKHDRDFKLATIRHNHFQTGLPGQLTAPSLELLVNGCVNQVDQVSNVDAQIYGINMLEPIGLESAYLVNASGATSAKYILSKYNFTN